MRRALPLLLVLTVVAGCASVPEPVVTFFAAGRTVTVTPSQYCSAPVDAPDAERLSCPVNDPGVTLRVPPGSPVQISVPAEASSGIWHVAMGYRTPSGETRAVGSRNFVSGTDSARHAFTLRLPTEQDQLELVQVRSVRQRPGSVDDLTLGVWNLRVA